MSSTATTSAVRKVDVVGGAATPPGPEQPPRTPRPDGDRASGRSRPPRLLLPALAISDRFRTSTRLGALVVILLVPGMISSVTYDLTMSQRIAQADLEHEGVGVLKPALRAMAGEAEGTPVSLTALDDAVADHPALDLTTALQAVHTAATAGGAESPPGRIATSEALAGLITRLATTSGLLLDPDLDAYSIIETLALRTPKALLAADRAAEPDTATSLTERIATRASLATTLQDTGAEMSTDLATATSVTTSAGLADGLTEMTDVAQAVADLGAAVRAAVDQPVPADATTLAGRVTAAIEPATAALDQLIDERISNYNADRWRILSITLVGAMIAVWLAAAVWWRTRHDVSLALSAVTALSAGDLAPHDVPTGNDEFGTIGTALDAARRKLEQQLVELQEAAADRQQQAQQSFVHQRLAEQQARQRAQEVVSSTSVTVVEQLTLVTEQVAAVRRAANTIDEKVQATDAVTRTVVTQAAQVDVLVTALADSLQDIARMASIIAGVADQTKLLALNATIEAARAGDAGDGFKVVAGEVKELAATTATSTEEIAAMVAAVEGHVHAVSQTMTTMTTGIGGVDGATEALRQVAAEQRTVVDTLDRAVSETIDRVSGMGDLAATLERRGLDRFPWHAQVTAVIGRTRRPARQLDLGEGGTRLVLPLDLPVQVGNAIVVETELAGRAVSLSGRVVRVSAQSGGQDAGIQFEDLDETAKIQLTATLAELSRSFASA